MIDFLPPNMFQDSGFRFLSYVTPIVIGKGLAGVNSSSSLFHIKEQPNGLLACPVCPELVEGSGDHRPQSLAVHLRALA